MIKLNTCPFCGVEVSVRRSYIPNGWKIAAEHRKTCYLYGKLQATFVSPKRAIQAWNRRAKDATD